MNPLPVGISHFQKSAAPLSSAVTCIATSLAGKFVPLSRLPVRGIASEKPLLEGATGFARDAQAVRQYNRRLAARRVPVEKGVTPARSEFIEESAEKSQQL